MTGPYATGAPLYWKAGFTRPLPLAGKVLTVKGYTGHDGALVSWPDLQAWIETRGESNIGLRAAGWIGLDVDAYGAKVGAQSWANALAELGELPATVSSTARGPGQPSRIYLYRVPSAAVFDDAQRRFGEAFGPNVDVIHRSHRYIAVWPSLNPDAGGAPYRWYDPAGAVMDGVPELGQLPDLPGTWLEFLAGGTAASSERKAASPTLPGDPFTSPGHTPWTRSQMLVQVNPLLERLAARGRSGRTALDDLMAAALVTYRFVPAFMTREKADEVLLARLLERGQADGASDPATWKWSARHELEKAWKDRAYEAEAADDQDPLGAPAGDDPGGAVDDDGAPVNPDVRAELYKLRVRAEARELHDAERHARGWRAPEDFGNLKNELTLPDEAARFRVAGLLGAGHNAILVAGRKAGKTTTVNELVRSLVDDEPFLGRFAVTPAAGDVAIFNYEVEQTQYRRWLREVGIVNTDRVHVLHLRGKALPMADARVRAWVAAWLRERGVETWVVDPYSRAYVGSVDNGNDEAKVGAFLDSLDRVKEAAGVSQLVMPVHSPKAKAEAGEESAIGSQRLEGWPDALWYLTKDLESGARFLRAEGRDIDHPEEKIVFDETSRRLTIGGGSRVMEKGRLDQAAVEAFIRSNPGCGFNELTDGLEWGKSRVQKAVKASRVIRKDPPDKFRVIRHWVIDNGFSPDMDD